jgi:5-methylcytosine-specific restriction endonuclease McrA
MGHRKEEWREPGQPVMCPGCATLKPPEEFYSNKRNRAGLSSYCKVCTTIRNARSADWYRVVRLERKLNSEERVAKNAASRWGNHRRWRYANPEHVKAYARMRAHLRRTLVGSCSEQQERWRWDYYGGRCWMCGEEAVEMDHVIAVNRGGSGWPANLRPACRSCNARKRDKPANLILSWVNTP